MNRQIFLAILIVIIGVATAIFISRTPQKSQFAAQNQPTTSDSEDTAEDFTSPEWNVSAGDRVLQASNILFQKEAYIFDKGSFRIRIPQGWTAVNTSSLTLPKRVFDPYFAFRTSNSDCVALYAKFERLHHSDEYPQITYDQHVQAPEDFLSITRRVDPEHSESVVFSPTTPPHFIPYEIYLTHYFGTDAEDAFILFAENGKTLTQSCSDEYVAMLGTVETYLEPALLTDTSEGLINFVSQTLITDDTYPGTFERRYALLFRENKFSNPKKVANIEESFFSPLVYKDIIYYIDTERDIAVFDILTQQKTKIVFRPSDNEPINTFFIHEGKLFYLAGAWCKDYLAKCSLSFYEYNLETKISRLLTTEVPARDILGYDSEHTRLALRYSEGDGGCFWATYYYYDFTTNNLIESIKTSGCDGDADFEAELATARAFVEQFSSQSQMVNNLIFQNGSLKPGVDTIQDRWGSWQFRFVED